MFLAYRYSSPRLQLFHQAHYIVNPRSRRRVQRIYDYLDRYQVAQARRLTCLSLQRIPTASRRRRFIRSCVSLCSDYRYQIFVQTRDGKAYMSPVVFDAQNRNSLIQDPRSKIQKSRSKKTSSSLIQDPESKLQSNSRSRRLRSLSPFSLSDVCLKTVQKKFSFCEKSRNSWK